MVRRGILQLSLATFLLSVSLSARSQTTSEFRGLGRTGIYNESGLLNEWPEEGPEKLWSTQGFGTGYTSPAMGKEYLYITGRIDSMDYLTALDYEGKQIWQVEFGRSRDKSYPDARSIPTINNDKIYLISGKGEVACHNSKTGDRIWKINAYEEFSGIEGPHGIAESPLVVDDKVFYTPGGFETSMIALDKNTGELLWETESLRDSTAYVSPLYVKHNGRKMIIQLMANIVFGVDPDDGRILWKYNYLGIRSPEENPKVKWTNCNTPIYHEGEFFITKGYDHPAAMFKLNKEGTALELKWINDLMDTHHGGNVLIDGYLYGSTWINNANGNWACIDWETGTDQWEAEMNNKGSIIAADGMLYLYDEKRGQLALVKPDPEKFNITSFFKIDEGTGPHWTHPVIHKGILYVRHGDVLITYNIRDN